MRHGALFARLVIIAGLIALVLILDGHNRSSGTYIQLSTLEARTSSTFAEQHVPGAAAQHSAVSANIPTQPVMTTAGALSWSDRAPRKQRVAILAACRSNQGDAYVSNTPLQSLLLPSVARTVTDHEREEFDVRVYVGLDSDDTFWLEHATQLRSSAAWLELHVRFYEKNGQRIPFNELAQEAFADGADVFVRVNDDTEFLSSGWIALGVTALSQNAPGAGVVGPDVVETASMYSVAARDSSARTRSSHGVATQENGATDNGDVAILTHDMVSRTHLDIFPTYYPVSFDAWYVDDWITQVYRPWHSEVLPDWRVAHHNRLTRYTPNPTHGGQLLEAEVHAGQERVRAWLAAHSTSN